MVLRRLRSLQVVSFYRLEFQQDSSRVSDAIPQSQVTQKVSFTHYNIIHYISTSANECVHIDTHHKTLAYRARPHVPFLSQAYSPPTHTGAGHQWTVSTNIGCNQWLSLAEPTLKMAPAGRNHSPVAHTNMCGWTISRWLRKKGKRKEWNRSDRIEGTLHLTLLVPPTGRNVNLPTTVRIWLLPPSL